MIEPSDYVNLDLFSGIGGFSLAARRLSMRTGAFCEIDDFCRKVLAYHWPDVYIHDDIRTLTACALRDRGIFPNLITGGFPCQDISGQGKGAGLLGKRSGLWFEMLRLIRELQPRWVVTENVPHIRTKPGLPGRSAIDTVLDGLEEAGYASESFVVGAKAVGAPQLRQRVWIVSHTVRSVCGSGAERTGREAGSDARGCGQGTGLEHSEGDQARSLPLGSAEEFSGLGLRGCDGYVDHANGLWEPQPKRSVSDQRGRPIDTSGGGAQSTVGWPTDGLPRGLVRFPAGRNQPQYEWEAPRIKKRVHRREDQLRGYGNSLVPQVAEVILSAIMEMDGWAIDSRRNGQ